MKSTKTPTDLIGMRVGHLTVIEFDHRDCNSKQYWKCFCDACGNYKVIRRCSLVGKLIRSCGCLPKKGNINTYDLTGNYGIGFTSKGEEFYFDLDDYEKIKQYNWYIGKDGYVKCSNPNMRMHRLVMGAINTSFYVDHIHHNKIDNRKSELRIVTPSQNQMNSLPREHSCDCKGISWHKCYNKWIVQIGYKGKIKYLGMTDDLEKAKKIREKAESELFGEYAYKAD